jgi:hypothetical protein
MMPALAKNAVFTPIPVQLSETEFNQFILPYLSMPKRGPKVFHMCWPLSEGSSKRITIDEEPNHQIVHLFGLGKANRAAY